jgi:hypothetical protein
MFDKNKLSGILKYNEFLIINIKSQEKDKTLNVNFVNNYADFMELILSGIEAGKFDNGKFLAIMDKLKLKDKNNTFVGGIDANDDLTDLSEPNDLTETNESNKLFIIGVDKKRMFGNDYKEILTYLLININHLQEFINDTHPVTINDVINNILEKTTSYHLLDKKLKKKSIDKKIDMSVDTEYDIKINDITIDELSIILKEKKTQKYIQNIELEFGKELAKYHINT